jgi:dTDP-glucose 4,6-dehydratase/UDP-glucuronate decarboxylase
MDPHDGRVIPDFVFSAVRGGPLVMFSDGTPTRSFCYITDAMQGFLRVLCSEYHGEVFNVGNDRGEISVSALAALVNSLAGGGMKVKRKRSVDRDYCTDNPARRCPDVKKIRALLGFRPRVSLTEGLRRMIAYYKERGISGRR